MRSSIRNATQAVGSRVVPVTMGSKRRVAIRIRHAQHSEPLSTTLTLLASAAIALTLLMSAATARASDIVFQEAGGGESAEAVSEFWSANRMAAAEAIRLPEPKGKPQAAHQDELDQMLQAPEFSRGGRPRTHGNGQSSDGSGESGASGSVVDSDALAFDESQAVEASSDVETQNSGSSGAPFSSSRTLDKMAYPFSSVGRLFFTNSASGRSSWCSASVVDRRFLVTAGHCVHSGNGLHSGWHSNFLFVPLYGEKTRLGDWTMQQMWTTGDWFYGGGGVPNAHDFAAIQVADKKMKGSYHRVGDVTGWLGWQTYSLVTNHVHILGYPGNFDGGNLMHQVASQSQNVVSPNNVEYGSDMRGGASGGPFVQNFGVYAQGQTGGFNPIANRVVGVVSYGYISTAPKINGASVFDGTFLALVNAICNYQAGNCSG